MKHLLIFLLSTIVVMGVGCSNTSVPPTNSEDSVEIVQSISFENSVVGIEKIYEQDNSQEKVYILNLDTNNKQYLDKPEMLIYRPINALQKIDEQNFSFVITATPHFGQYVVYNTDGDMIDMYPVGDQCYFENEFPQELQKKAQDQCLTNPTFGTLDDLIKNLRK